MSPSRAGFALLLALAACVLVLASLGAWLRARHHVAVVAATEERDTQFRMLRAAGETLFLAWASQAGGVVYPPGGGSTVVVADRFGSAQEPVTVLVRAYDGCAAMPATRAVPGDALLASLPPALQGVRGPRDTNAGPELSGWVELATVPGTAERFPSQEAAPLMSWVDGSKRPDESLAGVAGRSAGGRAGAAVPALAVWICPHQPAEGAININTAPLGLLRSAYAERRLNGFEDLERARTAGVVSEVPAQTDGGVKLVASSTIWNARIDITVGAVTRSWWVVAVGKPGQIRMVQRHVLADQP